MRHSARIVRREIQHHENLATRECAWFGMIRAEIPYEFEVAFARKELARKRSRMTEEQVAKELRRIDAMRRLKHSPHEFRADAGPHQSREAATAALAGLVEAAGRMDPYCFEQFCHTFWYPDHCGFKPKSPESLGVLARTPDGDAREPASAAGVNIAERSAQHRENVDTCAAVWFGVITVENPTAWAVARERQRLGARRAKLTDKQIARAERAIERLMREPYGPPAFIHEAGPYRERERAVAAVEQMVAAAKVMAPDQHDEFCRDLQRTADAVGGW